MSSHYIKAPFGRVACSALLPAMFLAALPALAGQRVLRVCSDPNNLPFSNSAMQGFENRMADLLARDLDARLEYTWWPQRKSFIEQTLNQHRCDVLIGVPAALESVLTTRPYYRSSYVFVSRRDRDLGLSSLSDARLTTWRIGIHIVGDDFAPPSYALARRGIAANLIGYSLLGAEGEPNPPARLIDAVARGDIDLAIAWGPLAGYFARREKQPLDIVPVSPSMFMGVPFTYDIAVGVRREDEALRAELDRILGRECVTLRKLLSDYGVPMGGTQCDGSERPRLASR